MRYVLKISNPPQNHCPQYTISILVFICIYKHFKLKSIFIHYLQEINTHIYVYWKVLCNISKKLSHKKTLKQQQWFTLLKIYIYQLMRSHRVGNNLHRVHCWPHHTDPTHSHGLLIRHQRTHSFCKMTQPNEYNQPKSRKKCELVRRIFIYMWCDVKIEQNLIAISIKIPINISTTKNPKPKKICYAEANESMLNYCIKVFCSIYKADIIAQQIIFLFKSFREACIFAQNKSCLIQLNT